MDLTNLGKKINYPAKGILAQSSEAKGKEYNATIGQAFLNGKAMSPVKNALYSPAFGNFELRKAWQKYKQLPLVTNGITHGLFIVKELFVDVPVIIPNLYWGNYKLIFDELDTFPMFNNGFNVNALKEKLSKEGKKVVLINFPNNPTGYSLTKEEALEVVKVLKEAKDTVIILDDAYQSLGYEDVAGSLFGELEESDNLVIKLDGMTKEYYSWGLRVGFITCNKDYEYKIAAMIRRTISNVCTNSQREALRLIKEFDGSQDYSILKERYLLVKELVKKYGLEALPFNSGYFMCLKVKNAEEIRKRLLSLGIGVISVGDSLIRIAYSSIDKEKLPFIFEKISEYS